MKPFLVVLALALLPGIALANAAIQISAAWARASILPSRPGAAYLTLQSDQGDRLLDVTSPIAKTIMIHQVLQSDGVSRMLHLPTLDLQPGQALAMAPGHLHLMMLGLTEKLVEGTEFPLVLQFENAGEVSVNVSVLGIAALGPAEVDQ